MSPEAAEYGDGLRTGSAWVSLLGFSSLISGLYTRSLSIPCIVLPVRCLLYLGSSSSSGGWFRFLYTSVAHRGKMKWC
ncbi:unnamed protein product [Brassica oleracea var. botrytis]